MKYRQAKKGKLLIDIVPGKCDFCGCCVGICPEDAIELKEAEIFIIDPRCTNCAKCIWSCPFEVIRFNKEGVALKSSNDLWMEAGNTNVSGVNVDKKVI
jgi:Fe-S-cluster-containing hydrogenase component 2